MRWLLACLLAGCAPSLDGDPARVDEPRVLAVQAEPAEARPGEPVTLRALVVTPTGDAPTPTFSWCDTPRPVAENRVAAEACLRGDADALTPIGAGDARPATVPAEACARFGSEPPPAGPDEVPRRPADPDPSGGYHQPVRVAVAGAAAVGRVRLTCALPDAPAEIARRFAAERRPNTNPGAPTVIRDGDRLTVRWDPADAEAYLRYEPADATLERRDEVLEIALYASGATLADVIVEAGAATARVVPDGDGAVRIWAVLHDDRGGVAWGATE